jgi:hypothetical protein
MQKPLEIASIFYNNRPRIRCAAPLFELLRLVHMYRRDHERYSTIEECTKVTVDRIGAIFSNDILELSQLDYELKKGIYKITMHGRIQIKGRLNTVYSDGKDFKFVSSELKVVNIPPLRELRSKITETEEEAVVAMFTSKEVGKEIGVEVRYDSIEFLSSCQPSSSLSFQE